MHIELSVSGQRLRREMGPGIVGGSRYYLTAHVAFAGHDWDGCQVWLCIDKDGAQNAYLLDADGCVTADRGINLPFGQYTMSLLGLRDNVRITTNVVPLCVLQSGADGGDPLPEIPQTAAEQIALLAQEAVDTARSVRKDADEGRFDGAPGKNGAPGKDGVSATHQWDGTVLTITSASGTSSADLRGPQGPEGERGQKGERGEAGPQGERGETGAQGVQGEPGRDGLDAPQDAVRYGVQALDEAQQEQARGNIGAASSGELSRVKDDMPVQPYQYGVNLLDRMTAAQLHDKVAAGDFAGIRNGDYVEVTLNGSFWDYGTYTCPNGTTYYSDIGLATSAGTNSGVLEATYVNDTYCEVTLSGTKYYVATSACDDHFVRTLTNAVMKYEANVDAYYKYGDSGLSGGAHHIAFVSRDLLPTMLKMRKANDAWTNAETDNPWLGSALYKTFNDPEHGILALMTATSIGPYIYAGQKGNGMRFLGEKKAAGVRTATGWSWFDRGKLWVPSEREVWGADVFSEHTYGAGLALQMPVFAGSLRHIVKGLGNNGSRSVWWCLSSVEWNLENYCSVNNNGAPTNVYNAANAWVGAPVGFVFM